MKTFQEAEITQGSADSAAPVRSRSEADRLLQCKEPEFCVGMRRYLGNATSKGISVLHLADVRGNEAIGGVVYRTHRYHQGVMLNFCPWCGQRILWIEDQKARKADSANAEQPLPVSDAEKSVNTKRRTRE